jgi:hypothetical protein
MIMGKWLIDKKTRPRPKQNLFEKRWFQHRLIVPTSLTVTFLLVHGHRLNPAPGFFSTVSFERKWFFVQEVWVWKGKAIIRRESVLSAKPGIFISIKTLRRSFWITSHGFHFVLE